MAVRLGVSLVCDRIRELGGWVEAIETAGFDAIGFGDSPALYPETYVQGTVVALHSRHVRFGPRVTNPLTRHVSVTASAMAALHDLSGGRALLGIGAGDSAVHAIGEAPATLAQLREYVLALRELFATGETVWRGQPLRCPAARRPVPIYLVGSGPRSLRLAAEIGDGVIIGGGIDAGYVAAARDELASAAVAAGRSPDDLDVWWLCGASIAADRATAVEAIGTHLAAAANACFRSGFGGKAVPQERRGPLRELVERYDFSAHEVPRAGRSNADLVDELGLRDYLAARFTVAGSPGDVAAQIEEAAARGAQQLWFTMPLPDKHAFLDAMRDGVVPRLAGVRG